MAQQVFQRNLKHLLGGIAGILQVLGREALGQSCAHDLQVFVNSLSEAICSR